MYTTLTLICLQQCLHYAPYNGAAKGTLLYIANYLSYKCCNDLKFVSAFFYQIFIFSQNDSHLKTLKNPFYFI